MSHESIIKIVSKYPGLDVIALKGKGYKPSAFGTLRTCESKGCIDYINGGWFIHKGVSNDNQN